MKIETIITQEHINNGKCKSNDRCPIALSFKKHSQVWFASIFEKDCWLFFKDKTNKKNTIIRKYNLPQNMVDFISKFDSKEKVEPQKFILNIEDMTYEGLN
jgi:hypothetical protein